MLSVIYEDVKNPIFWDILYCYEASTMRNWHSAGYADADSSWETPEGMYPGVVNPTATSTWQVWHSEA